jgi:hypothetical protein
MAYGRRLAEGLLNRNLLPVAHWLREISAATEPNILPSRCAVSPTLLTLRRVWVAACDRGFSRKNMLRTGTRLAVVLFLCCTGSAAALADSSSPLLAAYYDRQMAIVGGVTYVWKGDDAPMRINVNAVQVGVGRDTFYALDKLGRLRAWRHRHVKPAMLMRGVTGFAAGRSGVLTIRKDGSLWRINPLSKARTRLATDVTQAAVGDGANYYITRSGALFVRGKAHRGQYGDGKLTSSKEFIQTASDVRSITAHTGHAILLTRSGDVLGTGGNIYGPVGRHGLGDKADQWSGIMSGATAIATGALHSVAIRRDGMLVAWGDGYGPEPVVVMSQVIAAAAGSSTSIALRQDGTLWQWDRGQEPRRHRLK